MTASVTIPSGPHAGTIVLGSAGGGVWSSNDHGVTWTARTDDQPDLAIGTVALDPTNPDHIVAGTGEDNQNGDGFYGDGVLVSTDAGQTWVRQDPNGIFDGSHIGQVAIDPTNPARQFVAASTGFFESTDGGASWALPADPSYASVRGPSGSITAVVIDPTSGAIHLADATGAWPVAVSTDHGLTFANSSAGLSRPGIALSPTIALAMAPSSHSTLYASIGSNSPVTLYRSQDGGATWAQLPNTPDVGGASYSYGSGSFEQGWYDNAVEIDPGDANHVILGGIVAAETRDGGASWAKVSGTMSTGGVPYHLDIHAIVSQPDGTVMILTDGGPYAYDPRTHAVASRSGNLNITQFYSGFSAVGGEVLAGSQDNGSALYRGAAAWNGVAAGDGNYSAITPNHPTTMFTEISARLLATGDSFASGSTDITPQAAPAQAFTPPMVLVPNSNNPAEPTIYFGSGGLYRTTTPISSNPSWSNLTGTTSADVTAIAVSPASPTVLFVGLADGSVLTSSNGGASFSTLPPQPFGAIITAGIAVNPQNAADMIAAFNPCGPTCAFPTFPHVGRWNGSAWTDITGNLPPGAAHRVVFDAGALVAATDTGVFASTNGGSSWAAVGTGIPHVQVLDLDVESDGLYAVTHGRGAWKLGLTVVPVAAAASEGTAFTGPVAAISDSDGDTNPKDFSATIDWGDGTSTTGPVNSSAGGLTVSGSHAYVDEGHAVPSVAVSDVDGRSASLIPGTGSVVIGDAPLTSVGTSFSPGGSTVVTATVSDANRSAPASDFAATISWGDGRAGAGTVTSSGPGAFAVSGVPHYRTTGSFVVTTTITDVGGSTTKVTSTATVTAGGVSAATTGLGYWLVARDGGIFPFGQVAGYGSTGGIHLNSPIVGMATTPSGNGYWLVASDGGIFPFGDAGGYGSTGGIHLNQPIVGMTATASGGGYWLVASDGGIFPFGDARGYGSTGGIHLNSPIVGMALTSAGGGYWLVASDGGIFPFGDARGYGSTGGIHLNSPIVGMALTGSGGGYWLVASDGGIFPFGDAGGYGSAGGIHLNQPIVGMATTPSGKGYWLVASDGGIFPFGNASGYGSTGGTHLNQPIVGMAPG